MGDTTWEATDRFMWRFPYGPKMNDSYTSPMLAEVVAEIALLPIGEINVHETGVIAEETIADPIAVEQPSQEEW
jgi:hypothetical protein